MFDDLDSSFGSNENNTSNFDIFLEQLKKPLENGEINKEKVIQEIKDYLDSLLNPIDGQEIKIDWSSITKRKWEQLSKKHRLSSYYFLNIYLKTVDLTFVDLKTSPNNL